ncbi:MAG: NYN domain-containing protein [Pyrinomonadaceae bacterium]|nr:NYN domain-containing protein [Pyrinomonadaceae bacterium]
MPYLVDGNNVMGQRVGWHRDKAGARRRLLDEVAGFVRNARVTVSVVFDGAPDDHFPDGSRYRGVQVFYAARNSNADERIKRIVDASRERRTLIVVTSDRALADYVRQCGAQVIRAGDFRRRLDDAQAESESNAAHSSDGGKKVPDENLDHWMRYFGVEPEDGSEK